MPTLTVTAKGQVTLRKELLAHLGVVPGQKIEVNEMPGGSIVVKAATPTGTLKGFSGLLSGKTKKVATLEEINDAVAKAWAGRR
jgi:antitoxin PrlF